MTIAWRHRPTLPSTPVVPYERVYGEPVEPSAPPIRRVRSRPEIIIDDVCEELGVERDALLNHRGCRTDAYRLLGARCEAARRMRDIGLTTTQIGRWLKRDHSTVLHYLGRRPT